MKKIALCVLVAVVCIISSTMGYALTVSPESITGKAGELVIVEIETDNGEPVALEALSYDKQLPILSLDPLAYNKGENTDGSLANPPVYEQGYVMHTDDPGSTVTPVGPAKYYLTDSSGAVITYLYSEDPFVLNGLEIFRNRPTQKACVYSYNTEQNVGLGYLKVDYVMSSFPSEQSFTGQIVNTYVIGGSGPYFYLNRDDIPGGRVNIIGVNDPEDYDRFDSEVMETLWEANRATISGPSYTSSGGTTSMILISIKAVGRKIVLALEEDMNEIEIIAHPRSRDGEIDSVTVPVTIIDSDKDIRQDISIRSLRRQISTLWRYIWRYTWRSFRSGRYGRYGYR